MSRAINTKRARNVPRQGVIVQRNSWSIAKQCNAVLEHFVRNPLGSGRFLRTTALF